MSYDTFFVTCAILSVFTTITALVRARAIGWAIPVWFVSALLTSELAILWLIAQVSFVLLSVLFIGLTEEALSVGISLFLLSWLGLGRSLIDSFDAGLYFERALRRGLGDDFLETIPPARRHRLSFQANSKDWMRPFKFARPGVQVTQDISYGDAGKRNLLDVYTPVTMGSKRPVLLQIHGGAWILGHKQEQAQPLLHHMAEHGWVCVSINYRLSPRATFPDHIIDVKKAIRWIKENIEEYGGDPEFIAVTGGSAGGHLTSLAALTPNYEPWQPGFEDADTHVQAAMPMYAAFDFLNRHNIRQNTSIDDPIISRVMKMKRDEELHLWDAASPIARIHENAPPFMVVQGTHDTLIWNEEARRFVAEFSQVTSRPLIYAELPGAQHAFEVFHSPRTSHFLNAAAAYLEWAYADWMQRREGESGE